MTDIGPIPRELYDACKEWPPHLQACATIDEKLRYMSNALPPLLRRTALFRDILSGIVNGNPYPDISFPAMFESEILLYRDRDNLFSVRMYIWQPGDYDPIHDHNSWGVIGTAAGAVEVITYRRTGDGSASGHATLSETERCVLGPGETCVVRPLNEGIHMTGNPGGATALQVSVYGPSLTGRNYVNTFDPSTGTIRPLCSPKTKRRLLARAALDDMDG